jgi:DNA polymerase-3 subunit epsilon
MREIVLDTETTGLSPRDGHRIVEIGCVEMVNRFTTGRTFHCYLNPDRDMPAEAFAVHGLSASFLADKPRFSDIVGDLVDFLAEDRIVAHNASFDLNFLNHELAAASKETIAYERVVDTLMLARRKHPGGKNDLDTLCGRYGIDNARRTKHGALLDAEILAEVYAELLGGRQAAFILELSGASTEASRRRQIARQRPVPLERQLSADDLARHEQWVEAIGPNAVWAQYLAQMSRD